MSKNLRAQSKEYPGKRLMVHSRSMIGNSWTVNHRTNTDKILVLTFDNNYRRIVPNNITKSDNNTLIVDWGDSVVEGIVSVFKISPITNSFRFDLTNATDTELIHKFNTNHFLMQCWNSNDELVVPSRVIKVDDNRVDVNFDTPFTGYVDCVTTWPEPFTISEKSNTWLYKHRYDEEVEHILLQCYQYILMEDDQSLAYDMVWPNLMRRIDVNPTSSFDNIVEVDFDEAELNGVLENIIHGYRI